MWHRQRHADAALLPEALATTPQGGSGRLGGRHRSAHRGRTMTRPLRDRRTPRSDGVEGRRMDSPARSVARTLPRPRFSAGPCSGSSASWWPTAAGPPPLQREPRKAHREVHSARPPAGPCVRAAVVPHARFGCSGRLLARKRPQTWSCSRSVKYAVCNGEGIEREMMPDKAL